MQVADGATPTTSPGSLFYNGERELESVPHESLAQATTVHYGKKPDLKSKELSFGTFLIFRLRFKYFLHAKINMVNSYNRIIIVIIIFNPRLS